MLEIREVERSGLDRRRVEWDKGKATGILELSFISGGSKATSSQLQNINQEKIEGSDFYSSRRNLVVFPYHSYRNIFHL